MSIIWPDNPDPNWKPGDRRIRMTLTRFLLDRIAEDEEVAREAEANWEEFLDGYAHGAVNDFGDRITPARVLAECAAKRAIVEMWPDVWGNWNAGEAQATRRIKDAAIRALALPYADDPDYDEAWRP